MPNKDFVVVFAIVLALAVSFQPVVRGDASPSTPPTIGAMSPSVAATPLVVPLAPESDDHLTSRLESVSDAAVLGFTGAALLLVAAGVRRRAC
jgi:hypothetical protein